MALFEGKTPAERNKLIIALVTGALAVLALAYNFGLFSGSSGTGTSGNTNRRRPSRPGTTQVETEVAEDTDLELLRPVVYNPTTPGAPAVGRNIFTYYTAPVSSMPGPGAATLSVPTPEPTPPLLVTSVSAPGPVYAGTGEFKLQVSGDKFTPLTRVYIDNAQELPTRFISAQQLEATVAPSFISSAGMRQISARTPDGTLFSNMATLNITPAPTPAYTYVGIIGDRGYRDKAILKDSKSELITVQLGDLVGGRFRISAISERAVEFTDQQLKLKHAVAFSEAGRPVSSYSPSPDTMRDTMRDTIREARPPSPPPTPTPRVAPTSPQPPKREAEEEEKDDP